MAFTSIASLTQVKNYLRMPNPASPSADDMVLQMFMDAAQKAIEVEIGHIVKKTIRAERHDGGRCELWLRNLPVLYVSNVEEGWGYYNWELDDQEVNTITALSIWAFSLDDPIEGLISRRSAGNVKVPFVQGAKNIRVDYTVGRTEMPANAVLAFCELVAHWYRFTQQRTSNSTGVGFQPSALVSQDFTRATGVTSINMGVPLEILEMLKSDRKRPIIG